MRHVVRVSPLDAFRSGLKDDERRSIGPFSLSQRHLFNPTVLLIAFELIVLLSSPFSRVSWLLFVSVAAFVGYLYFDLRAKAFALVVRRVRAKNGRYYEGDVVQLKYEFHNTEVVPYRYEILFEDDFGPSREEFISFTHAVEIRGNAKAIVEIERTCNATMGRHRIGPMQVRLRDLFGLFEFRVIDDEICHVELLPRIKSIGPLPVRGSASSLHYGLYEVAARGLSVNFAGIRPYVIGDSLRHVAWKISGKHQELMVKEFEKVVSCDVTIVLDLDPRLHVGLDHVSTWDQAKHVALSIAKQQVALGNLIQLFANDYSLPACRGDDAVEVLARGLASLDPRDLDLSSIQSKEILNRVAPSIPSSSTLVYISVFDQNQVDRDFVTLGQLKERDIQIFVVLIDSSSYLTSKNGAVDYAFALASRNPKAMNEARQRFMVAGLEVALLRYNENLGPNAFHNSKAERTMKKAP